MTGPDGRPNQSDDQLALEIEAFELDRALAPVRQELLRRHPRWATRGPRPADLTAEDLHLYRAAVAPFSAAAQQLWFDTIRRGATTADPGLSENVARGVARLAGQRWDSLSSAEQLHYQQSARAILGLGPSRRAGEDGGQSRSGACER